MDVPHDNQVEEAVLVEIAPGAAHRPVVRRRVTHTSFGRDIREGAVAVVVVELAAAVAGHVELEPAGGGALWKASTGIAASTSRTAAKYEALPNDGRKKARFSVSRGSNPRRAQSQRGASCSPAGG